MRSSPVSFVLLGLLLAMLVVIGLVLITDEVTASHGFAHAEFPDTMQQGGPGAERHSSIRWLGLVFGLLEILFFVSCLLLGLNKLQGRIRFFFFGALIYATLFAAMVIADHFYAVGTNRDIVLGFPLPTALMVYGVGGAPLVFVLLYVLCFDRWILTPEDMARFEQLVRDKQNRREPAE